MNTQVTGIKQYLIHFFVIVVFSVISESAAANPEKTDDDLNLILPGKVIVIDPGHGGRNSGVKGPDGTLEKSVVLKLAGLVKKKLSPKITIILTRTGDYHLDIYNRTSAANHHSADLFVSLHTGGSFIHNAGGLTIFYYSPPETQNKFALPDADAVNISGQMLWDNLQTEYLKNSKKAASIMQFCFEKNNKFQGCRIQGAPLLVLKGATMPAILFEIGMLSNPGQERNLYDDDYLSALASEISEGIIEFLKKN